MLTLRYQLSVLQRRLGPALVRFTQSDRALLAALLHRLHRLPKSVLTQLHLVVRSDTVLKWYRNLITRRHAERSRPKRVGRPRTGR